MELMYTPSDKHLFWVAGYTADGNTRNVTEQVTSLLENAQKFAEAVGCELDQVMTDYITESRRYKYTRVFYVKTDNVPKDTYSFGNTEWTMWKWLTD